MGFEGPERLSIDQIQAGLHNGSIERGDPGSERITTPDGTEIMFYPEQQTIIFEVDEARAELSLNSGVVRLSENVSDKTIYNSGLEKKVRYLGSNWKKEGLFD